MYEKYYKRIIDICLSLIGIIILSPIFSILILAGTVFMGGNPFFVQPRPGKNEEIFHLIKFRTMNNRKDSNGKLLADDKRLNKYGKFIRSTSLDELPELINILKGDMSFVGPRPQLVRDMVFMTKEQRKRHSIRQGLTGWAQVNGRNSISWEDKLNYDLEYIDKESFIFDVRIICMTVVAVFKRDGITMENMETAMDYGDYLLKHKHIDHEAYNKGQQEAQRILMKE